MILTILQSKSLGSEKMNNHFSVVVCGVALISTFVLSLQIFASIPDNCGITAQSWAFNRCVTECEDIGLHCMHAQKVYAACVGGTYYQKPQCFSVWYSRCSDNNLHGQGHSFMVYDPTCY